MNKFTLSLAAALLLPSLAQAAPQNREALFGETHVHTKLSFDAFIFGNRNGPDDAYRYAKGEAIKHPAGFEMKLPAPLDFQAITDHAMYLGMVPAMFDQTSIVANHPVSLALREAKSAGERRTAFGKMLPYIGQQVEDDLLNMDIVRSAWAQTIAAAERHNEPGKFTAFTAYEYTSSQDTFENLHRNVIFEGDAPSEPFSRLISKNPENLWRWMDSLRDRGMDSLAIPHNSNGSDGYMFWDKTYDGKEIDARYSAMRMRNEPLVEISQVKGTSETHPLLSPNDEFADFEIMPYQIATWFPSKLEGSYIRQAYRRGLELQEAGAGNPFKFGLISASDTHVGAGAFTESNYWSKIGMVDYNGMLRGSVELTWMQRLGAQIFRLSNMWTQYNTVEGAATGLAPKNPSPGFLHMQWSSWGASGLAGVWAEENTRSSIFAAMRRKETFGTSGPRMRVRFFAGYDMNEKMLADPQLVTKAYAKGVPMGSDLLIQKDRQPDFLVWAMRDPLSAPLQRMQIVKGWVDSDGKSHEQVYDIACAEGAEVDMASNRCPDNNASVDVATCDYTADTGADELKAHWRDPSFKADENAFYYVRALENPTCRWSSWDALRAGSRPNPALQATIQERVWSSPIWLEH
ncbi:DUF3604 domain-containing protein [Alphaproteobacteria bacterium]|nr:DUF3604 domain-containing protein [Alphaproteobacteria bacterium]MDC0148002.1 DUF3604 domain-containing protein [Alphaproteobacteria bacterium]